MSERVISSSPLAVSSVAASKLIGVSDKTLYTWRKTGQGPHYRRINGRIIYPIESLKAFLNEGLQRQPAA